MDHFESRGTTDIETSSTVEATPLLAASCNDDDADNSSCTAAVVRSRVSRRRWKTALAAVQLSTRATAPTYSAPGVFDDKYSCTHEKVSATCIDYNADTCTVKEDLGNTALAAFLSEPRPAHSKVRWLHINGVSFDVMKSLAHKYQLHPLAVEDIFHTPQRIKVDTYNNHLYVSVVLLTLQRHDATPGASAALPGPSISPSSPPPLSCGISGVLTTIPGSQVVISQASLLLTSDSTVISISENPPSYPNLAASRSHPATATLHRLRASGTLLRSCEDPSFLLHAILDASVDAALPVVDAFSARVNALQAHILGGALDVALTAELHLLSGDLTHLRRCLAPLTGLIHALRKSDGDAGNPPSALLSMPSAPPTASAHCIGNSSNGSTSHCGGGQRWLSPLAATYLLDVQDHISSALESLDALQRQCKDLVDLVFNMLGFETNAAMKALAVLSTVFLPITFIAGVYGTNFTEVREYGWRGGFYVYFLGLNVAVVVAVLVGMWMAGLYRFPHRHTAVAAPAGGGGLVSRFRWGQGRSGEREEWSVGGSGSGVSTIEPPMHGSPRR